jgi:monoamine oxidase
MARSESFRRLQWLVAVSEEGERRGVDPVEAVDLARRGQLWKSSRRGFLTGAGLVVGGLAMAPSRVFAAPVSGNARVAVVGAGIAGLGCVDTLRTKGISATLFEGSTRIGGRCWSMGGTFPGPTTFEGQVVERGGELIDTLHGTMRGWAREFGLAMELAEAGGDTLFYFGGESRDEGAVIDEYRRFVDAMRADLRSVGAPTAESWTPADRQLDEMDLASYLDDRGAEPLIRAVVEASYRAEYGGELSEQSALNLLLFIHADRRSKFRPFGVFSDERYHVVGGNQQIVEGLAARNASSLRLDHRLLAIAETPSGQIRLTFGVGRGTIDETFDQVVLAIPFTTLREVDMSGFELPSWKRRAIDELRYGSSAKHMVGFTARPWRAPEIGGSGAMYADLTHLQNVWETSQSTGTDGRGVLTDYLGGARGRTVDPRRSEAETSDFLSDLDRLVPGASATARRNSRNRFVTHIENWSINEWQRGGYTCNHPGYFTTICDYEAPPVRALHFAGEHTSSFYEWQGFMEGAAVSGVRAATEVYAAVR